MKFYYSYTTFLIFIWKLFGSQLKSNDVWQVYNYGELRNQLIVSVWHEGTHYVIYDQFIFQMADKNARLFTGKVEIKHFIVIGFPA